MAERLFISHASDDDATVARIVAYLEANGRACWISSRDIPPQSIYAEAIAEGMQECGACVVILSAASNQSKAVKRELELASHYDKPFIPIRIDSTEPAKGFDYYLRNAQWLDYGRHGERALDRMLGRSTAPQSAPAPVTPATSRSEESETSGARLALIIGGAVAAIALTIWVLTAMQPSTTPSTEIATDPAPVEAAADTSPPAPTRVTQPTWMLRLRDNPIVPAQEMAGIRIGERLSDVQAALGAPSSARDGALLYGTYRRGLEVIAEDRATVSAITLFDDELSLARIVPSVQGAGIGSTKQQVVAALGQPMESGDCFLYRSAGEQGIAFIFMSRSNNWRPSTSAISIEIGPGYACA